MATVYEMTALAREAAVRLFSDHQGQVDQNAVLEVTDALVQSLSENPCLGIEIPLVHGMITAFLHEWSLIVEAASSGGGDLLVVYAPEEGIDTTGLVPPRYTHHPAGGD